MKNSHRFFFIIILVWSNIGYSQKIDSLLYNKKFIIGPVFERTPELGTAFGIAGVYRFIDKDSSYNKYTSTIDFILEGTTEKQYIALSNFKLAHPQGKWLTKGDISYKRFPFRFYGTGDRVNLDSFTKYKSNFFHFRSTYYRQIKKNLLVGGKSFFEYYEEIGGKDDTLFKKYPVGGLDGGRLIGIGAVVLNDNRNQNENTWNGHYAELYYMRFGQFIGSQYSFNRAILDLRSYIPLHKKVSWANQFYSQINTGRVPFYGLSLMGGPQIMRGYFKGAYRNNVFESLQTEIRYKFIRNWEIVGFGGVGVLGTSIAKVNYKRNIKSGGLGLRIPLLFGKKLTLLRLDYAMGKNSQGFYFGIGEAF